MTDSETPLDAQPFQLRQYAYFAVLSLNMTPDTITQALGSQPDVTRERGARSRDPERPNMNWWEIVCDEKALPVDALVRRLVERLRPVESALVQLTRAIRADPNDPRGGCVLGVVRYFNDDEGEGENARETPESDLVRLPGQHQLLGWHLDSDILEFLVKVGAELDVDEYN